MSCTYAEIRGPRCLHGMQEVAGSSPASSTRRTPALVGVLQLWGARCPAHDRDFAGLCPDSASRTILAHLTDEARGWRRLYSAHVLQAHEGADLDFVVGGPAGSRPAAQPRDLGTGGDTRRTRRVGDSSCAVRSAVMERSAGAAILAAMTGCLASRPDSHDEPPSRSARPDGAAVAAGGRHRRRRRSAAFHDRGPHAPVS